MITVKFYKFQIFKGRICKGRIYENMEVLTEMHD